MSKTRFDIEIELHDKWENKEYCLKKVRENGYNLYYVKKQDKEICLEAARNNIFGV